MDPSLDPLLQSLVPVFGAPRVGGRDPEHLERKQLFGNEINLRMTVAVGVSPGEESSFEVLEVSAPHRVYPHRSCKLCKPP